MVAAELPDSQGAIQEIYRQLSELLDIPINLSDLETTPYNPCQSELGIAQIVQYAQTSAPYSAIQIECNIDEDIARIIQEKAIDWPGIDIEVESIRVVASTIPASSTPPDKIFKVYSPPPDGFVKSWFDAAWQRIPYYERNRLNPGASVEGPVMICEQYSTTIVNRGWHAQVDNADSIILHR